MKAKTTTLLLSLIVILLFPVYAFADTLLHDEPPGTIITFSEKQWMILDQNTDGTTFIILNSNNGNRKFSNSNKIFNPGDGSNIGYYLNNYFYNNLSQKELIETKTWDIKDEKNSGGYVTCNIALISHAEYNTYRSLFPSGGNGYDWWTRTPYSNSTDRVYYVTSSGGMTLFPVSYSIGVRPALYLNSGILVSETKEVIDEADITPPAVPTGLTATATSPNALELSWDSNTEPDFASYNVYRDDVKIKGTAINSCTDTGLSPATTYVYTVTAVDASANESAHSEPVSVTTPAEIPDPPPMPENITVSSIADTNARLEWDTVVGAEEYKVYLNGSPVGTTTEVFFDLTGLEPETDYTLTVTVLAGGMESVQPQQVTITTLPAPESPPGKPELNATALLSGGAVRLSWSLDDPTVTSWELYINGELIKDLPGDQNETIIRDLDDGSYDFSIRAKNSAGAGELSETVPVNVKNIFGSTTQIADVFNILAHLFKAIWPLLAFIIALIALPKFIQTAKSIIVARR